MHAAAANATFHGFQFHSPRTIHKSNTHAISGQPLANVIGCQRASSPNAPPSTAGSAGFPSIASAATNGTLSAVAPNGSTA